MPTLTSLFKVLQYNDPKYFRSLVFTENSFN